LADNEKDKKKALIAEAKAEKIENYWVKVFKNCEVLQEEMNEKDEPILNNLKKVSFTKDSQLKTFVFEFAENEFFSNTTLTKVFHLKEDENSERSEGTSIEWKDGKDVTKKTIKKK